MTPIDSSLQKYYDDTFSMMATPGWAALMEDFNKLKIIEDIYSKINLNYYFYS